MDFVNDMGQYYVNITNVFVNGIFLMCIMQNHVGAFCE